MYAETHNLLFSTDPNPNKSKSKCIYMTGPRLKNAQKPVNLTLNDKILPWVNNATHLGNKLHIYAHTDFDCNIKRARFIDSSL